MPLLIACYVQEIPTSSCFNPQLMWSLIQGGTFIVWLAVFYFTPWRPTRGSCLKGKQLVFFACLESYSVCQKGSVHVTYFLSMGFSQIYKIAAYKMNHQNICFDVS